MVDVIDSYAAAADATSSDEDPRGRCFSQARAYLGVEPEGAPHYEVWQVPALFVGTELIGPSRRQQASGQIWAACLVYPSSPTGEAQAPSLTGSVRDALRRRTPDTAQFSQCLDQLGGSFISCTDAHRVEVFGGVDFPVPVPELSTLRPSCLDLVTNQTSMPDPTAGGTLTIDVAVNPNIGVTYQDGTPGQVVQCTVVPTDPDQALTTTLRQLGTAPPPLR